MSQLYPQYNHTKEDYTAAAVDTEKDYNKKLRLEEAWMLLLDSAPHRLEYQNIWHALGGSHHTKIKISGYREAGLESIF